MNIYILFTKIIMVNFYYALTFKYNRSYYYDPPEYLKDDVNNILCDKIFVFNNINIISQNYIC